MRTDEKEEEKITSVRYNENNSASKPEIPKTGLFDHDPPMMMNWNMKIGMSDIHF